MGKKIRVRQEQAAAQYEAQMSELRHREFPKKTNKRSSPIYLPAVCHTYPSQRPIDKFKCSSCSPARRSAQLLKYLYCTYAIPAWLMDWLLCEGTVELASAAHERSLALLMSIVYEMGNGRSPRPILRPYLSKAEMAIFFRTGRPADLQTTAFSHFVYCKALARGLPRPVCAKLAHVASEARLDKLKIFQFVQNFVEFCAVREVNQISVQDIWDYLRCNQLIGVFSFKG